MKKSHLAKGILISSIALVLTIMSFNDDNILISVLAAQSPVDGSVKILNPNPWEEDENGIFTRVESKKVGIGTNNPTSQFQVVGVASITDALRVGDGTANYPGYVEIFGGEPELIIGSPTTNAVNSGSIVFRENTVESFTFKNDGESDKLIISSRDANNIMVIKRSGYIGINAITNPSSPLTVGGIIETSGGVKVTGGGVTFPDGSTQTTAFYGHAADNFTTAEVNNVRANKLADGTVPWTSNMPISGGTFTGQVNFPQSGVWNALGRVGIGETNPEQSLVVNGVIETYEGIKYPDGTIQTTAYGVIPAQNLTESEVNNLKASKLANGTVPWTNNMPLSGGTFTGGVQFAGSGIWASDGKVGVGTLSPSQTLTVAGKVYSTTGGYMFPDGSVQTRALPENFSASKVVVTSSSGLLTNANTTATEIGLLSGLTVNATNINQALTGISAGVIGSNLNTLVGGGNTTLHSHQLNAGATDVSVSASALNQALYGIGSSVTGSNLNTLTNGSTTTLHKHQLNVGATDVTASASEINQVTDGVSSNVTASNLNILIDNSSVTTLHRHKTEVYVGDLGTTTGSSIERANISFTKTATLGFEPKYFEAIVQYDVVASDTWNYSSNAWHERISLYVKGKVGGDITWIKVNNLEASPPNTSSPLNPFGSEKENIDISYGTGTTSSPNTGILRPWGDMTFTLSSITNTNTTLNFNFTYTTGGDQFGGVRYGVHFLKVEGLSGISS